MLASRWPHSIGTNLWPLEREKLRVFRYSLWQVWNRIHLYVKDLSFDCLCFLLLPPIPPLGRAGSTTFLLLMFQEGMWWYRVEGAWIEYGRGVEECGEFDGQEREFKGRGLGPSVSVIKDCSALWHYQKSWFPCQLAFFPWPQYYWVPPLNFLCFLPLIFPANNQWHFKLDAFLKGTLVPP